MNTAPHLSPEDRAEFGRVLEEALRTTAHRRTVPGTGAEPPTTEQLRAMALGAAAAIAACAAAEYGHFVQLRDELRRPGHAPDSAGSAAGAGAGLVAMLSVLAPVLAGTAAVIFLVVGHVLRMLDPEPAIAAPLRDTGWAFAALTAAALLAACVGLLVTALRHGSGAIRADGGGRGGGRRDGGRRALAEEVELARVAWRTALLERGMLPFLRNALEGHEALDGPGSAPGTARVPERGGHGEHGEQRDDRRGKPHGESRHPRLGYTHPGFSSPASDRSRETGTRTGFTSPDFTGPGFASPDFGGPEHTPD
ncbi:hypothetical protein V1L54_09245 [Streptomyces sp. TRM 70361]|uniref:hypothetical protein n=1 Tax=Streptomyces sp. TRM 70361 TaxID=3116553 RepID=UPI002E7B540B|nr:hypothetical protein [Streptomyces sp. TRM 70361]MEE1939599.1 hypothetical protein [Streptomyces sp. TRM 70361]